MKTRLIFIAVTLIGCGCASPSQQADLLPLAIRREATPAPALAPSFDYTYQLLTPHNTGLTQVFDDGASTFITFESLAPAGLMIFDENGKPVSFSVSGASVLMSTVRTGLLIRTPSQSSYAQANSPQRTARIELYEGAALTAVPVLPPELAQARAEILSAQRRLAGLSAELEMAVRGEEVAPLSQIKGEIKEIQTRLNGIDATLIRAHFASGSAQLDLSQAAREVLIGAAQISKRVRIEGGADAMGAMAFNSQLAFKRARQVRQMLEEGGVARKKLSIRVASAQYVASNATPEGRAENRRVDVMFVPEGGNAVRIIGFESRIAAATGEEVGR